MGNKICYNTSKGKGLEAPVPKDLLTTQLLVLADV